MILFGSPIHLSQHSNMCTVVETRHDFVPEVADVSLSWKYTNSLGV